MKLTLLGTGTPEVYKRRASSSYLIDIGDDTIMFDCGGGAVNRILDSNRKLHDIDYLFFSHLHSDHMIDFARLAHNLWDENKEDGLIIYGPEPLQTISDRYFSKDGPLAFDLIARTESPASQEIWRERSDVLPRPWPKPNITEVQPGFSYSGKNWKLTSVEVPHVQPYLNCMGFRIDSDGKSIVYSGDSGPCQGLTDLSKDADIMLHMCFQSSKEVHKPEWTWGSSGPLEIAKTAKEAGVKKVILTHIREKHDTPDIHEQMLSEMAEIYDGEVMVAEDLMTFEL